MTSARPSRMSRVVPQPTVSLRSLQNLLGAAAAEGLAPAELLAASDIRLPDAGEVDVRVRAELYHRLWRIVVERLQDPSFPLRAALSSIHVVRRVRLLHHLEREPR